MTVALSQAEIEYNDATHTYTVHGLVVPSVTRILREMGMYKGIDFMSEEAKNRGTAVHEACELADSGFEVTNTELNCYINAYMAFKNTAKFKTMLSEYKVYHEIYGYAGRADKVGRFDGNPEAAIIDIKTGLPQPTDALQVFAYATAYTHMTRQGVNPWVLYLRPDGTFKLRKVRESSADVWRSLVLLYNYKRQHGLLLKEAKG